MPPASVYYEDVIMVTYEISSLLRFAFALCHYASASMRDAAASCRVALPPCRRYYHRYYITRIRYAITFSFAAILAAPLRYCFTWLRHTLLLSHECRFRHATPLLRAITTPRQASLRDATTLPLLADTVAAATLLLR